jgi:hypothetical protein
MWWKNQPEIWRSRTICIILVSLSVYIVGYICIHMYTYVNICKYNYMYVCIQHVSTIHVIPCYILIPSDPKKFGHLRTVTPVLTLTSSHNGRWHNYKFIQIISTIHMLIIISYDIPIKISLKPSNISSWYPQNGESSWCLPHHSHSICIYTSLSHSWMIFAWTPRYISVPDYRSLSPCIPSISPCLSPSIIFTAYIPIIFPLYSHLFWL